MNRYAPLGLLVLVIACQTPDPTAAPSKPAVSTPQESEPAKPIAPKKKVADFSWTKADESYSDVLPTDYLVEFGHSIADDNAGGERVTAEANGSNRVFVIYRSDAEKNIIRTYLKNPSKKTIFSHGVFLAKTNYNKPFRWIWRPTGYQPGKFAQETCDGSPTILNDMARSKSTKGWSGINMEGNRVPHACFWSYQPIRVVEDGKEIWRAKDYVSPDDSKDVTRGNPGFTGEEEAP